MDEIPKRYFRIGEICSILDVPPHTVRCWVKWFDLDKNIHRTRGRNDRRFTHENLDDLKEIKRLLKEEMFTVKGVQKIFKRKQQEV